jgi:hypothetical protein
MPRIQETSQDARLVAKRQKRKGYGIRCVWSIRIVGDSGVQGRFMGMPWRTVDGKGEQAEQSFQYISKGEWS